MVLAAAASSPDPTRSARSSSSVFESSISVLSEVMGEGSGGSETFEAGIDDLWLDVGRRESDSCALSEAGIVSAYAPLSRSDASRRDRIKRAPT